MRLTILMGMANPTPAFPLEKPSVAIAVFIPISSPFRLKRPPPEFPGLIAASCCMKSSKLLLALKMNF